MSKSWVCHSVNETAWRCVEDAPAATPNINTILVIASVAMVAIGLALYWAGGKP